MPDPLEVDRTAPPDYVEALGAVHTLQRELKRMAIRDPRGGDISLLGIYGALLAYMEADVEREAVGAGYIDTVPPADDLIEYHSKRMATRVRITSVYLDRLRASQPERPQLLVDLMDALAEDDGSDEDPRAYQ
jgi:hypothetical protein